MGCYIYSSISTIMTKNLLIAFALSVFIGSASQAQNVSATGAGQGYVFAPLPYAYDALEPSIDKQTMEIHYDRHHRAYYNNFVKAIEQTDINGMPIEDIFQRIESLPESIRNNGGGYYNHTLFWSFMSPKGGGKPKGKLAEDIDNTFGSLEAFKTQFETAGAKRFGSGWVWLSVDEAGKLFISSTANQDNPVMSVVEERGKPILCVDVWEHAYYLKYQNKRAAYLTAFWNVVNWDEVAGRYEAAK